MSLPFTPRQSIPSSNFIFKSGLSSTSKITELKISEQSIQTILLTQNDLADKVHNIEKQIGKINEKCDKLISKLDLQTKSLLEKAPMIFENDSGNVTEQYVEDYFRSHFEDELNRLTLGWPNLGTFR
jgi:hypothetical protein